ncbi:hypothetical protein CesoFtcFv8_023617 [Champsocephalus esox]|uniref:Uncharacterized protein n=1 Tax=Champsocephalus esox TaxID=159716 RepID=A0AAN8B9K9_9TELE|nr:hypothetical protein CesoFtcFv8_023617 [Champsocephalus esox]
MASIPDPGFCKQDCRCVCCLRSAVLKQEFTSNRKWTRIRTVKPPKLGHPNIPAASDRQLWAYSQSVIWSAPHC